MGFIDEAVAALVAARDRLEEIGQPVEVARQYCAEAAGYVAQATETANDVQSAIARTSDAATQVRECAGAAIEAINAEIARLQAHG